MWRKINNKILYIRVLIKWWPELFILRVLFSVWWKHRRSGQTKKNKNNTGWLFNMVKRDPSWLRNRRVKCFSESRPCRKKRKKRKYGSGAYSNIIYTNTNRCLGRRHCLRLLLLLLTKMTWLVSKQWLYIVPRTLNGPQNKCASR